MCPLVLSPGTVVETWNGGQRQPLISRLLQHQWIQQKQQLQEKKYCSVGFFLGDKKWKDGNSGKGGDRKPQNLSSLCPSKRKPWSSGTWEISQYVCARMRREQSYKDSSKTWGEFRQKIKREQGKKKSDNLKMKQSSRINFHPESSPWSHPGNAIFILDSVIFKTAVLWCEQQDNRILPVTHPSASSFFLTFTAFISTSICPPDHFLLKHKSMINKQR